MNTIYVRPMPNGAVGDTSSRAFDGEVVDEHANRHASAPHSDSSDLTSSNSVACTEVPSCRNAVR
jgi:hypothetical protein